MKTTDLLVEYLIIGAITEIWLLLFLMLFLPLDSQANSSLLLNIEKLIPIILIPYIAITYILGGILNFLSSAFLNKYFQKKYRNELFEKAGTRYYDARKHIYKNATEDEMKRFRSDGHIIRISRSSILNFIFISVALFFYIKNNLAIVICILISISIAIMSFFQWKKRFKSNFSEMLDIYLRIPESHKLQQIENSVIIESKKRKNN